MCAHAWTDSFECSLASVQLPPLQADGGIQLLFLSRLRAVHRAFAYQPPSSSRCISTWRQKCGFVLSPTPAHPGHSVMVWRVYGEVLVCTDVGQVGSAYQSRNSTGENHPLMGLISPTIGVKICIRVTRQWWRVPLFLPHCTIRIVVCARGPQG